MLADLSLRLAVLLGLMGGLALLETRIPRKAQPRSWGSRAPNLLLMALFFVLNLLLTVGAVGIAARFTAGAAKPISSLGPWTAFFLGIAALDFAAYAVHVLLHKVPVLWRVHRVHHSDELVDVTTAYRQHPLETLLRFACTIVPAALLGISPAATAAYRLLSGINALFEHANIRLSPRLDRALRWLVVTPDMHKVHHSCVASQTDSNYGNIAPWFDRLCGTYVGPVPVVTYGLDLRGDRHRTLVGLLRFPWCDQAGASGSSRRRFSEGAHRQA
jgi:sterol desaturase/sphingolipid hydroxylase (fatty acid hydroxylase superfamily)